MIVDEIVTVFFFKSNIPEEKKSSHLLILEMQNNKWNA